MAGDGSFEATTKEPLVGSRDVSSAALESFAVSEAASVPRWDMAREEFARQWSKVQRRVVLFIEPSPFA